MSTPRTVSDLRNRILIAKVIVRMLNEDPDLPKDIRQSDAIKHYQAQQLKLEKELYTIIEPPPVVVGLQAASLSAKSKNTKE